MIRDAFRFDLKFDREITAVTILSTLLIMIDRYHNFTGIKVLDRVFIYLLIPLLVVLLADRKPLREAGFQWGDWKAGVILCGVIIALAIPILYFATRSNSSMIYYYQGKISWVTPILTFLDLFGWEFFFRGWILFAYARKFGDHALWLQAVPFALGHLGKPEIETLSTIFGGFLFGMVAWRTKSFVYPFIIHWFIFTYVIFVASGGF